MALCKRVLGPSLAPQVTTGGLSGVSGSKIAQNGWQSAPYLQLAPRRTAHQRRVFNTDRAVLSNGRFTTELWRGNSDFSDKRSSRDSRRDCRIRVSQGNPGLPGQLEAGHANLGVGTGGVHYTGEDHSDLASDTGSGDASPLKAGHVSLDEAVPLHLNETAAGQVLTDQPQTRRRFGNRLRRNINRKAADILHTFRKEEKMKAEYATEEEELAALNEQRYKLASGLKRTLLRIGVCFVVLAVIKIINALREALLATPVDYFKLVGVLGSLDYWALAVLVFDIRNTIMEIERNDGDGDPTVRVLEQENVAIGISFEKFFKRMFKVLSAIAFAQVLGALSMTGFQLAPSVDNGLKQLWGFVSPHL